MRIFIGTVEICQWIRLLGDAFREQGHEVITYAEKAPFFNYDQYTLRPDSLVQDYIAYRIKNKRAASFVFLLFRISNKAGGFISKGSLLRYMTRKAKSYLYKNTDLYIQIWAGLENDDSDLNEFKKNGARIVTWFAGSDVRDYDVFKQHFGFDFFTIPEAYRTDPLKKIRKLRHHEKYSDAIFSVPDQSSLALRPYFHLQIPLDCKKYTYNRTLNKIPVVIHLPTNPEIKGSAIIEKAIEALQKEGLEFNYISKSRISHEEVCKLLSEADILVDELILHGPGVLGFEAMLSGCAVATRYYEDSPSSFRPPIVSINESNIIDRLRELIVNFSFRNDLIESARTYALKNNSASTVASDMLQIVNSEEYHYYPDYFREHYKAENKLLLDPINGLTQLARDCDWYKKYVRSGERDGLVF